MPMTSIKRTLILIVLATWLAGCSTTKDDMLTHGDKTMMDIWEVGTGGSAGSQQSRQLMDARQSLRRPLSNADIEQTPVMQATYTRTAVNEIHSQFQRLPNPDMVMYIFPHLAGTDPVPVPGYTTVFPLYQRVQYAMPGERTENY
ncbi:TIGR03751 family conjugal transfer lipoprotein [Saezia sanguinis]|nr:TIGR03751 family conjugal transfer lipoprotein [Saezia sanguinis]